MKKPDEKVTKRREATAKKFRISPEDGVQSYASFHVDRLANQSWTFNQLIMEYQNLPNLNFLEVGCFEGVSAAFFLKNILTDPSSSIVCIDPHGQFVKPELIKDGWGHDPEHDPLREKTHKTIYDVFKENILDNFSSQVVYHREDSNIALRKYSSPQFDVIYLDGLHYSTAILSDMILSWPLLKKGGYMLLDDFGMDMYETVRFNLDSCFFGISAFLNIFQGQYEIINGPHYLIKIKKIVENIQLPPSSY